MKGLICVCVLLLSLSVQADSLWTQSSNSGAGHLVGDIYAYGVVDTLSVYLEGKPCENTKPYFFINPTYVKNGNQLISLVLAAKMAGKKIGIFYTNDDGIHCNVKGIRILD